MRNPLYFQLYVFVTLRGYESISRPIVPKPPCDDADCISYTSPAATRGSY